MKEFEADFLRDRYWGNVGFRGAAHGTAWRTEIREGESVPDTPQDRIKNYLNRFAEITDREDLSKREHGIAAIKRLVERRYVIKPNNISDAHIKSVLLGNEAELLGYQRDDMNDEGVRRLVQESLESKLHTPLESYSVPTELREQLEHMIITDQKSRMEQWLSYLTGEESRHAPLALRYWAFAEMLKQGDYDPVKKEYNKRTDTTMATFPELDQQALALVFDEVQRRRTGKASALSFTDEVQQEKCMDFLRRENFGKLYAFMQEHVRSLKLPTERLVVTRGEWKRFPKGSSSQALTEPLQGFQTKWCIAGEGHARSYLQTSDMLIYFSEDADGNNTIPRACIVDNKKRGITEVRGIVFNEKVKQHLDDYIIPVVEEKLKEIDGGKEWMDTMEDMKRLRELHFKHLHNEPFTRNDLVFLYELNRPIQCSGYGQDPRIEELRAHRNPNEDALIIFDCTREQIAHNEREITQDTKAYIGPLFPNIFQTDIEHIYTSFPEGKIQKYHIEIGGKTKKRLEQKLKDKNIYVSDYAHELLTSPDFITSKTIEGTDLVRLTVKDLGFPRGATTDEIYERAQQYDLELCPAEVGPHLRLSYSGGDWMAIAMKQISDRDGFPYIFYLGRDGAELGLYTFSARPGSRWFGSYQFIFSLRKDS
jgi:hypothetical protein